METRRQFVLATSPPWSFQVSATLCLTPMRTFGGSGTTLERRVRSIIKRSTYNKIEQRSELRVYRIRYQYLVFVKTGFGMAAVFTELPSTAPSTRLLASRHSDTKLGPQLQWHLAKCLPLQRLGATMRDEQLGRRCLQEGGAGHRRP